MNLIVNEKIIRRKIRKLLMETSRNFQTSFRSAKTDISQASRKQKLLSKAQALSKNHNITFAKYELSKIRFPEISIGGVSSDLTSFYLAIKGNFRTVPGDGDDLPSVKLTLLLPITKSQYSNPPPSSGTNGLEAGKIVFANKEKSLNNLLYCHSSNMNVNKPSTIRNLKSFWESGIKSKERGAAGQESASDTNDEAKAIFYASIILAIKDEKIDTSENSLSGKKIKDFLKSEPHKITEDEFGECVTIFNAIKNEKIDKQFDYLAELAGYAEDSVMERERSGVIDTRIAEIGKIFKNSDHKIPGESGDKTYFQFFPTGKTDDDEFPRIHVILLDNQTYPDNKRKFCDKIKTEKSRIEAFLIENKDTTEAKKMNDKDKNAIVDKIVKLGKLPGDDSSLPVLKISSP